MPTYVKEIKPVDKMVSDYPFLFFNYFFSANNKQKDNNKQTKSKNEENQKVSK